MIGRGRAAHGLKKRDGAGEESAARLPDISVRARSSRGTVQGRVLITPLAGKMSTPKANPTRGNGGNDVIDPTRH